nr:hypothetical protein [Chenggangzhangella methanolivorans]
MPTSQTKKARPTGPSPSPSTASHSPVVPGQTVVSSATWQSAASAAVARQKPATASVGVLAKKRLETE